MKIGSEQDAYAVMERLHAMGVRIVILSSIDFPLPRGTDKGRMLVGYISCKLGPFFLVLRSFLNFSLLFTY